MRVLDVGCGPGTITAEIARRVPDGDVVAVDSSEARLSVARGNLSAYANASAVAGDARSLPFDDASFDLVYSRFLLEHVPYKRRAADELARVCRPGGTVLLQGLDGQLVNNYPPDPDLQRGLGRALAHLSATGFDPHVGRRLRTLLQQAGLVPEGTEVEPYQVIAGSIGAAARAQWCATLDLAAGTLTKLGFPDGPAIGAMFLDYLDRDDTITFSHLFTSWARKP
jgi:SAM-dependent methyltransferase